MFLTCEKSHLLRLIKAKVLYKYKHIFYSISLDDFPFSIRFTCFFLGNCIDSDWRWPAINQSTYFQNYTNRIKLNNEKRNLYRKSFSLPEVTVVRNASSHWKSIEDKLYRKPYMAWGRMTEPDGWKKSHLTDFDNNFRGDKKTSQVPHMTLTYFDRLYCLLYKIIYICTIRSVADIVIIIIIESRIGVEAKGVKRSRPIIFSV